MKSLENHLNIDLTALEHNLKEIKKKIFPSKVMAVVKSNAYGHGMLAVAKRLEKKVAYFFVDKLEDAVHLRKKNIQTPILVGVILYQQIKKCVPISARMGFSRFCHFRSFRKKSAQNQNENPYQTRLPDMGRFGFELSEYENILDRILKLKHVEIVGVYSHLASSEALKTFQKIILYLLLAFFSDTRLVYKAILSLTSYFNSRLYF